MLHRFQYYIKTENLFQPTDRLLVAVSGGVDSVVLCELCKQAGFNFSIVHCNFELRGNESDGDENFVKELASGYRTEFISKKFDTVKYAKEKKLGIQEAARILRYEWFTEILNSAENLSTGKPVNFILTAHHADDNIETLLMNFFKGTGIAGLQGIHSKSTVAKHLVRPLLFAGKGEIIDFAKKHQLVFREDTSNNSNKYTRNYFRNELIPSLEKVYPQVRHNLIHNIERFKEVNILYNRSIEEIKKKLQFKQGNEIHIPVLKLIKTPALHSIMFEIIKEFGYNPNQVNEVLNLLKSDSGKYVDCATHRILRNRKWLIISKLSDPENLHFLIERGMNEIVFPLGKLKILAGVTEVIPVDNNMAMLDASLITFPLLLRKWKQGDYFYPLGMKHKKKLSRFFIDKKLSLNEKESTWVVEGDKKIIWIIGHRIDERFRVNETTTDILKFTLNI
ncbi:MAG: tRNA lysidine(34) synthetase TilS [Ferruginibacter sp.]